MHTLEPRSTLREVLVNYQVGRPNHPLTPPEVRQWYQSHFSYPKCVAWHHAMTTGFKAGIDEVCWRDSDVKAFHLEWSTPAKGPGFVALVMEPCETPERQSNDDHTTGHTDSLPWPTRYERALGTATFTEEALGWFREVLEWLTAQGHAVAEHSLGGDA